MASTITQTILNYTCLFKHQKKILLSKGVMSEEDKGVYVDNVIRLMNEASGKLFEQAEVAKSYPPEDALSEWRRVNNLIGKIAEFEDKLEKSGDFGRTDVRIVVRRLIDAVYELELGLKIRAFSNKRHKRNIQILSALSSD